MRVTKSNILQKVRINKYLPEVPITHEAVINDALFLELKEQVFKKRPQLRNIIDRYGSLTLYQYAKHYNRTTQLTLDARKQEFINTYTDEVKRLLGSEVARSCRTQLETTYRITTTDHHGPLSEPGMVNSNIHEALPYLRGDEVVKNIMVLGCANVSFDNATFPRGLLFHTRNGTELILNQLTFFSRAVRPCPVIYFPAYTTENLESAKTRLAQWEREGSITKEKNEELSKLLNEVYAHPSVMASKYFSEQVTKTNFALWKKIMKDNPQAPNLIYIEQEGIVNKLLEKYHLDQKTLIHKMLFTSHYHTLILKYFDGILRGFSTKEKTGTYLFWALPKGSKYRVQLWKKGDFLQTEDGTYKIPLTPEGVRCAIRKKELIPSTLMSFIILSFYYGVRLVGGRDQTTYLTDMKKAFTRMQKEAGDIESIQYIKNVETRDLSLTLKSIAFFQAPETRESRVSATGIDFLLYGNQTTFSLIRLLSKLLTLREAFYRTLPDFYQRSYKEEERDPLLASITKEDLEKYLGLGQTIIPSAKIE